MYGLEEDAILTPPQLHVSTLARSLDLLPQLFDPPREIGFNFAAATSFLWQGRYSLQGRRKRGGGTFLAIS